MEDPRMTQIEDLKYETPKGEKDYFTQFIGVALFVIFGFLALASMS